LAKCILNHFHIIVALPVEFASHIDRSASFVIVSVALELFFPWNIHNRILATHKSEHLSIGPLRPHASISALAFATRQFFEISDIALILILLNGFLLSTGSNTPSFSAADGALASVSQLLHFLELFGLGESLFLLRWIA
jgi:hypothetical protein